ncbi:MAG TPA: hypothetical protein VGO91_09050 [Pyrinomonadaceae bacterium]|jgi:hypothetical protein|nr:hypothetical protein [Pyrinomonadaceae bacterium]
MLESILGPLKLRLNARLAAVSCLLMMAALICGACKSGYPASANQNPAGAERGAPRQVKTARVAEMPMGQTVTEQT